MDLGHIWGNQLGMAVSSFFGEPDATIYSGKHLAMLDGISASFGLTVADSLETEGSLASSWAWASNLRRHVWVDEREQNVSVWFAARPDKAETFSLKQISGQLDSFLAYLSSDKQVPSFSVIDKLLRDLDSYRAISNHYCGPEQSDIVAIQTLLFNIAEKMEIQEKSHDEIAKKYNISTANMTHINDLTEKAKERKDAFWGIEPNLEFHAGLAVRHAGGAIFQRATAELGYSNQIDLFTNSPLPVYGRSKSLQLGGYYTPTGLARSLAEVAIAEKINLPILRICDPACGSGVFLSEVLRALERRSYGGKIEIVGLDISAHAVEIAKFVVQCAANDFGREDVTINITMGNALTAVFNKRFDIILMNPPFRSWEQCNKPEKELIKNNLGKLKYGKPDLSLAFLNLGYDLLNDGGTLASLLPAGALAADYSQLWRKMIAENAMIHLVGILGDHYIFDSAMVNIGIIAFSKRDPSQNITTDSLMLWANEDTGASASALRCLRRKLMTDNRCNNSSNSWRIYKLAQPELDERSNWAPTSSGADKLIRQFRSCQFPRLGNLFRVQQGIRTGANEVFLISREDLRDLPQSEQRVFRAAANKDNIHKFNIDTSHYVFYADGLADPITSEKNFEERFPIYFSKFIFPNISTLKSRPRNKKIWQLSEARAWLKRRDPRIISRSFIGRHQFGFAADLSGSLAVVQGYGWNPIWTGDMGNGSEVDRYITLKVYSLILSSELFFEMVKTVSVNIAGGQYDLAPKYINNLPLPGWSWIANQMRIPINSIEAIDELFNHYSASPVELESFTLKIFGVDQ
jgi:predicted RNA methylase